MSKHILQLQQCWDPPLFEKTIKDKEKFDKDSKELSQLLGINEKESLPIVAWFGRKGIHKDQKRQVDYIRYYLSERRYIIKFVTELFLFRSRPVGVKEFDDIVKKYSTEILATEFFQGLLKYIKESANSEFEIEEYEELYKKEKHQHQLLMLDLLYNSQATVIPTNSDLFIQWLECCTTTDFFSKEKTLATLAMLITVGFLDLEQDFSIEYANEKAYFMQPSKLVSIHKTISNLSIPEMSPILLAYGIVMHRVAMRLEEVPDNDYDIYSACVGSELNQTAATLVQQSIHLKAIENIGSIFEVLPQTVTYSSTCSALLQAVLPYVSMNESVANAVKSCIGSLQEIAKVFFSDPFANKALMLSRAKVPVGIRPFLKLAQALGADAFEYLYNMTTFMQELPRTFREYEFSTEKPSILQLTAELDLYERREDGAGGITLEAGATGEIISTGSSTVVLWNLKFNGWTFIGRILEQSQILSIEESDLAQEILSLINETLSQLDDESRAIELLDSLSEGLRPGTDIVELVTKILDESMYSRNIKMCVLGVKFLSALATVIPNKVWPYIGRTKLLERNGRGGQVATILGAVELVQCQYDFTISVIKLVNVLIRDAITMSMDNSVSQRIKSEALTKFVRHLIDVYESFAYWRYSDPRQRIEIASLVLGCLSDVLYSNYRVDNELTSVLKDCSKVITDQFLATSESCLRTLQPLLGAIESVSKSTLPLDIDTLRNDEQLHADLALKFCSLVLRVRSLLKLPISLLEKRLFIHSPDLAKIFTRYNVLHSSVIDLLESMISGYCHTEFDQPSLLAHLGTEYSQMLITGLGNAVQNSLESDTTIGNICNYFSAILVSQQEGLGILLLSGKDTRNTSNKVESVDSLLKVLEDKISNNTTKLDPSLGDQILDCIALAHSNWNLSSGAADSYDNGGNSGTDKAQFFNALFETIERAVDNKDIDEESIELANIYSMAAKAIKILSIEVYKNPKRDLKRISSKMMEYSKEFLSISGFRSSLHQHLNKNFGSRFEIALNKFIKSSLVVKKSYGVSYLYDMWLMDVLLGHEDTWVSGYRTEVVEANVNLSLVDSQIAMVYAWCSFITSLVSSHNPDKKSLRRIAMMSIEINKEATIIPLFQGIFKRRLDLAFYILYHCRGINDLTVEDLNVIFKVLVDTMNQSSDSVKSSRQLLKIISLALDEFSTRPEVVVDFQLQQLVHQILEAVVIKGMKSISETSPLPTDSNNNEKEGNIEDIVQLIMVLRKSLKIPGIHSIFPNLVLQMTDTGTDRAVMNLYSNCTEYGNDEEGAVYGELALLYMLEWLQVDNMADQFVINGLFGILMESPLSKLIQNGGIVYNEHPRLYTIWTNILTLILVLVEKLGSRIIPEIIVFFNFFQLQISSALKAWFDPPVIVMTVINETSQICLLFDIVTKLSEAHQYNQLSLIKSQNLPENGELVDAIDYLLTHQKYLTARTDDDDIEKIVNELQELKELLE